MSRAFAPRRGSRHRARARRPPLPVAVVVAVVSGYLVPAVTTAVNALLVPDPHLRSVLAAAAWTTIAVPGAVTAGIVTAWNHRRTPPAVPSARASAHAFTSAALAGLAITAAGSAVLIGNDVLALPDLQFVLPSGAIGAGMAARRWARTPLRPPPERPRRHPAPSTPQEGPTSP